MLASRSTHTTQKGRMQRKSRGFPYTHSALIIVPLILVDSCFPAPQTHEFFYPTTFQFISWTDSSDTTSSIPYADPSPGNGTICWLSGAWPRFGGDLAKQILVLLALSETVHRAWIDVSHKVVWDGARTRFLHPWDVWWDSGGPWSDLSLRTLVIPSKPLVQLPPNHTQAQLV